MELDTGAAYTLVSETIFNQFWKRELQPSQVRLTAYSGDEIPVVGSTEVCVNYVATLPLLVVKGEGHSLLGRNWLQEIRLDWQSIHMVMGGSLKRCWMTTKLSSKRDLVP